MEEYFTYKANSVEDVGFNGEHLFSRQSLITVMKYASSLWHNMRKLVLKSLEHLNKPLALLVSNRVIADDIDASIMVSLQVLSGPHKGRIFVIRPKSVDYNLLYDGIEDISYSWSYYT